MLFLTKGVIEISNWCCCSPWPCWLQRPCWMVFLFGSRDLYLSRPYRWTWPQSVGKQQLGILPELNSWFWGGFNCRGYRNPVTWRPVIRCGSYRRFGGICCHRLLPWRWSAHLPDCTLSWHKNHNMHLLGFQSYQVYRPVRKFVLSLKETEDGNSIFLLNTDYTESHPRRQYPSNKNKIGGPFNVQEKLLNLCISPLL